MKSNRLAQQLQFILEIDRLKGVLRRSLLWKTIDARIPPNTPGIWR